MRAIQCDNPTCIAPNFGSPKTAVKPKSTTLMSKLDISGDPQFGAIDVGFPHYIALADYNPLILVKNFKTEFCSYSYN